MDSLKVYDEPATGGGGITRLPSTDEPPAMPNGFYTLTFPDGSHRTFRVHTQNQRAKFAPGRRLFSILIGPDNTNDYERVGFVDDDGIKIWKRHKGAKVEEYARLVWMLATGAEVEGYELLISKRCLVCNRPLTDPASIEFGVGPKCRGEI